MSLTKEFANLLKRDGRWPATSLCQIAGKERLRVWIPSLAPITRKKLGYCAF